MQTLTYRLAVIKPGGAEQEIFRLDSSTPFGAMRAGDALQLDDGPTHAKISRVSHGFTRAGDAFIQTTSVFLSADQPGAASDISDPAIAPPSPVADEMASTDEFGS